MLAYLKQVYEAWINYPRREGEVIRGQYQIERFLGMGSYGLTYLCLDKHSGQEVVAKQAKPSKGQLGRDLLRREATIMNQLEHPSIPKCYTSFEESKRLYMITEYIQGRTVEDLIFERGARFEEKDALQFIRQLLNIVQFIHEHDVVHLDIRIPNVIVHGNHMSLIDFGLAARLGEPARITIDADDELIRRRTVHVTSDLYAIGHFLLYMLYSTYESSHDQEEVIRGWEEELSISTQTKQMIRKLLQIDPPYANVQACLEELDTVLV
ncbi:protein kinase domain-containing protein [Paenibacillus qinlingensis]|uniref:Serine/threonine-protein kinase n=1 Tax=Paenibacillus qinlingensis TaxID=1837343 RepID=A0ABU1NW45_9BACL|nr:protein kinase [Paenibacillus qinlingensis]MDR6551680.1 serine/threonine-protein kinase [Paenibacillus qinlingensis]